MAELLRLCEADEPRDLIHRAVHRLAEGDLVVLPTETCDVVAANSLIPDAVSKLQALSRSQLPGEKKKTADKLLLGLKAVEEVHDYVAMASAAVARVMRRAWPGPFVLALPVMKSHGLLRGLPETVQQAILHPIDDEVWEVWVRVPEHAVIASVMSLLPAPLIFWEPPTEGREISGSSTWIEAVGLILEDQPRHNQDSPCVVRSTENSWILLEAGIVTESQFKQMTGKVILFVCTGNTCRSPLAEGLFRKLLSDRLGCSTDELPERGYTVQSAGLAASFGAPAAMESAEVARQFGANLDGHSSQPLTDDLLSQVDHIYTMTKSHRDSILFACPDAVDRVALLASDNTDIADPIGGGPSEYEACGEEIARHLQAILEQWAPLTPQDDSR